MATNSRNGLIAAAVWIVCAVLAANGVYPLPSVIVAVAGFIAMAYFLYRAIRTREL